MRGSAKEILIRFSPTAFGWSGVQLFLLISGYLIHRNYVRKGFHLDVITYFRKRFWRIYPPYFITLCAIILLIPNIRTYIQTLEGFIDLFQHIFLVHNFSENNIYGINPSLWSLALEAQLYLLYPLFLFIRKKMGVGFAFAISFLLAVVLKLLENRLTNGNYLASYYFSTAALWYNWCAGAIMAEYHLTSKKIFKEYVGRISLVALIIFWGSRYFDLHTHLMLISAILFWTALMEWYLTGNCLYIPRKLFHAIVSVGVCSYSIYLIHQPIITEIFGLLRSRISLMPWPNYLFIGCIIIMISFGGIYLLANYLYKFIELPSIKYGGKKSIKYNQ